MSKIDSLLSRLEKIKSNGGGKWLACCPAHDDRSPSLAVKLTDDGKILLHCFTGCSVSEIVGAIDLELSDLMPNNSTYKKDKKPSRFNKYELFDRILEESTILLVAIKQIFNGTPLSEDDMSRVLKAESTIDDLARECRR